jgi:hypothetical protein
MMAGDLWWWKEKAALKMNSPKEGAFGEQT